MKLSKRDRFLIEQGFKTGESLSYPNCESWLSDHIDDVGHTVEDHIAFDASNIDEEE
jgi:hypothetical protein